MADGTAVVDEKGRAGEGELVKLVENFNGLIMAHRDMDAKALYEKADASGRVAILNVSPGYVTLLKRKYGLRED